MNGKKFIFILTFCSVMIVSSACQTVKKKEGPAVITKENTEPPKTDHLESGNYTYTEKELKEAYNEALIKIKDGEVPEKEAPRSAKESGFAVLPLSKEIYGVEAVAILPVETRALTEEELLQLAYEMQEISFEDLISTKYSVIRKTEKLENRPYTAGEKVTELKQQSQYFYKGKQPDSVFNNDPANSAPVYIELPENYYKPKENQISYEEIEKLVKEYLKEYEITEADTDFMIPLYTEGRSLSDMPKGEDFWGVGIRSLDGKDYSMQILADSGKLTGWKREILPYLMGEAPTEADYEKADEYKVNHRKRK